MRAEITELQAENAHLRQSLAQALSPRDGQARPASQPGLPIPLEWAAEQAPSAQRDFLQTLTDSVPVQLAFYDRELICQFANASYARWLRLPPQQLVGLHLSQVARPENYTGARGHLSAALAGETQRFEGQRTFPDGTSFYASIDYTPYRSEGEVQGIVIQIVDITQRKAAEDRVREVNSQLNRALERAQTVYNQAPCGYHSVDASGVYVSINDTELSWLGYQRHEVVGKKTQADFVMHDRARWCADRLQRLMADGQIEDAEFQMIRRDGSTFHALVSSTAVRDASGRFLHSNTTVLDITERKRVEQLVSDLNAGLELRIQERTAELLESHLRFRLMVDNMRDCSVFFIDAEGRISDWPNSAQRMDGFSSSETLGKHIGDIFSMPEGSEVREETEKTLRLAAARGQHETNTWRLRKDGSRYWAHSLVIALRDEGGELRGFAKINRDMTDAKRLDDLARNINDELENRVAERTEQLLSANKDLASFSYSVSHDLRSPLRHVSSFVSLLQEHLGDGCDEVSTRYLTTIGNSARHMSQLIDGLLAFSRLGRAAVNLAPVNIAQLVATVVAQLAHDAAGRIIDWVVAPDLPVVVGDALLLREVWARLLGNAHKYTRPRERARIEVGWSMDPAVGYIFFVRDNGVGFDTKYSHKLFGIFQRLHRATEFEGTGIGLALAHRIIERHGGTIWAESQVGTGSVFAFSLPLENSQEVSEAHEMHPAAPN